MFSLLINILYVTMRLWLPHTPSITQFERTPYSISSYSVNSGLTEWIKAVLYSQIEIKLYSNIYVPRLGRFLGLTKKYPVRVSASFQSFALRMFVPSCFCRPVCLPCARKVRRSNVNNHWYRILILINCFLFERTETKIKTKSKSVLQPAWPISGRVSDRTRSVI